MTNAFKLLIYGHFCWNFFNISIFLYFFFNFFYMFFNLKCKNGDDRNEFHSKIILNWDNAISINVMKKNLTNWFQCKYHAIMSIRSVQCSLYCDMFTFTLPFTVFIVQIKSEHICSWHCPNNSAATFLRSW